MLRVQKSILDFLARVSLKKCLKIFEDPSIARRGVETEAFGRSDLLELVDFRLRVSSGDDQENLLSQLSENIHVVAVRKLAHASSDVESDDF